MEDLNYDLCIFKQQQLLMKQQITQINKKTENNIKINPSHIPLDHIVQRCKKQYINILPNNFNKRIQTNAISRQFFILEDGEDYQHSQQIQKQQIQQVIQQLSVILQLLIQNCVLSLNKEVKRKSYQLILKIRELMQRDIQKVQQSIFKKTNKPVQKYKINFNDFLIQKREDIFVQISPQVSLYQDPLLFYCFNKVIHKEIFNLNPNYSKCKNIELINKHVSLLNPLYIPFFEEASYKPSKAKFTNLDDRLLLIGLIKYGNKNLQKIKEIYFSERTQQQLRNRIKNLCAKNTDNVIRKWKLDEYRLMENDQIQKLARGIQKFGLRWQVISKYLNIRTAKFLEEEYNESEKLRKKRERQNIQNNKFKEILKQYQQKFRNDLQTEMDEQNYQQIKEISPEDYLFQYENNSSQMQQEPVQSQPHQRYKIINNLTFQYDEI